MTRHANQQTNYAVASRFPSPHERPAAGNYWIEKLITSDEGSEPHWVLMSYGDASRDSRPGHELERLIKRAVALEGHVRIRRKRGEVTVWDSEEARGR